MLFLCFCCCCLFLCSVVMLLLVGWYLFCLFAVLFAFVFDTEVQGHNSLFQTSLSSACIHPIKYVGLELEIRISNSSA